jgi:sec-independent protein translocase protein TatA
VSLGPAEILVILVIALLAFGPKKLPEVGRQVGRTMREFRRFQETMRRDLHDVFGEDLSDAALPPPTLPPMEGPGPDETMTADVAAPETSGGAQEAGEPAPPTVAGDATGDGAVTDGSTTESRGAEGG